MTELRIATWNTAWRGTASWQAEVIRERLASFAPDIVCLTECQVDFLREWGGYVAEGSTDWGYRQREGRRQVLLWSRWPLHEVDVTGSLDLPEGRFVRAKADTPIGEMVVVGLVIPYRGAHVRHGRRDRSPWQEHCLFLDALRPILAEVKQPCIVLGDYNQKIPSTWVPRKPQQKLAAAFEGFLIVTADGLSHNGVRAIDHIAVDRSLVATHTGTLSNLTDSGRQLSDHFGVTCTLTNGPTL